MDHRLTYGQTLPPGMLWFVASGLDGGVILRIAIGGCFCLPMLLLHLPCGLRWGIGCRLRLHVVLLVLCRLPSFRGAWGLLRLRRFLAGRV